MMNPTLRNPLSRMFLAAERIFGPLRHSPAPRQASVYQEMNLGAAVAVAACVGYTCIAGASALVTLSVVPFGFCAGSVIGLLLWHSSGEFPEDPVLPPARGQERRPWPAAARLLYVEPVTRSTEKARRR